MAINFTDSTSKQVLFIHSEKTEKKQQSAEEFLSFQRENISGNQKNGSIFKIDGGNRTYDDQDSINQTLFQYADSDHNGEIDTKEYKTFLMKSVSDGIIGQEQYNIANGLTTDGQLSLNNSNIFLSDYNDLIKTADMYCGLLEADADIDQNGDGVLSEEEFSKSAALTITTGSNAEVSKNLSFQDSKSQNEKYKIMSTISDGIIGNVSTTTSFKYEYNYLSGQYEMNYVPETQVTPDYKELIDVADKYYNKMKE